MPQTKILPITDDYVYDISLDGTVVNALGFNVLSNTDGFNFKLPTQDSFRYTKDNPYIGKGLNRIVEKGKEYINEWADLMEFNDLFMRKKMGLDVDEYIPSNITVSRKNYLDLLDTGDVKLVGNTLKSKKMPIFIEKFIDKAANLLLNNKGQEFLEYYYDYIEKIYDMKIPLKDIASVGKIKTSIKEYKENCKQLTSAGYKSARQAWYELAIKHDLNVDMGDSIYYINIGTKKGDSDVKRTSKYYYLDNNNNVIDYVIDENGDKMLDRRGNAVDLTKHLTKLYATYKRENKDYKKTFPTLLDYGKSIYPSLREEDIIEFNCVLLPNEMVEDEDDHFCTDDFEYNRAKYIEMFNKRITPLLVVFDKKTRSYINEKGEVINNIIITNPKDRKVFTEKEAQLVCNQPFLETDQDTYEQLMTLEDKEIEFWLSIGKEPTYMNFIPSMNWEEIKEDYLKRKQKEEEVNIHNEIIQYKTIIEKLKTSEINDFIDNGTLPAKLKNIVDPNFKNGTFMSQKYSVKLGTIYDIIDRDAFDVETEEDETTEE